MNPHTEFVIVKNVNQLSEDEQYLISALRDFGFSTEILSFEDVIENRLPDTDTPCFYLTALKENEYVAYLSGIFRGSLVMYTEPSAATKYVLFKTGNVWTKSPEAAYNYILSYPSSDCE